MRNVLLSGIAISALFGFGLSFLDNSKEASVGTPTPVADKASGSGTAGFVQEQRLESKPRNVAKASPVFSTKDKAAQGGNSALGEAEMALGVPDDDLMALEKEEELQRLHEEIYQALDGLAELGPESGFSEEQLDAMYESADQGQPPRHTGEEAIEEDLTPEGQIEAMLDGLKDGGAPAEMIEEVARSFASLPEDEIDDQDNYQQNEDTLEGLREGGAPPELIEQLRLSFESSPDDLVEN